MMRITKPLRAQIITPNSIAGRGFGFVAVQTALRSLHGSTDGLDCAAYGRFIQICTDRRLDRQGRQLHGRLVVFSVVPDNFLASKLIAFYSRTRRLDIARKVFDGIPHRTTFSWNAMIIALSVHGFHSDVLRLFSAMSSGEYSGGESRPDNFTVTCVMKAVAEMFADDPNFSREVHSYVLRNGFLEVDVFVANSMITCYARCREVRLARALFDRIQTKDVVSWNSMLAAYSQSGFSEECKALFREMVSESGGRKVKPNSGTLVNVIQACGQSKDLAFGAEIHGYMIENGVQGSVILYNALIGFYAKCARFDNALELFEWMGHEKDEFTYRSLISGYMAHGMVDEAVEFFGRIRKQSTMTWNALLSGLVQNNLHERALDLLRYMVSKTRPNSVTLASLLPSISHFANLKSAREIHGHALRNCLDENLFVTTGLIDAYAKSGHLKEARSIFDRRKIDNNNKIMWTAMISAHGAHGDAKSALRLFHEMTTVKGIEPDEVTFTAVLTSCARFGVVDEARKIFESMESRFKVKPSPEHQTCMVSVLSRAGKLAEALRFVSKAGIGSIAGVWGALLDGAAIAGDLRIGKLAFDRLIEIEPENAGNYVLMANLFHRAGKFKEAGEVRERMNRAGFKKVAGTSWMALGTESLMPH